MRNVKYLILILSCFFQAELFAADPETSPPSRLDAAWSEHLAPSLKTAFDNTGLSIIAASFVLSTVAGHQDEWVREDLRGEKTVSRNVTKFGAFWGSGAPSLLIGTSLLVFDTNQGIAFSESVLLTTASHYVISRLADRPRPGNPGIKTSFPSGHTANAFAVATSLSYSYGWKAAVPGYTAAVLTMAARIAEDRHWLSDTVAAAALGIFWGRAPHAHHKEDKLEMRPVLSSRQIGLELSYVF